MKAIKKVLALFLSMNVAMSLCACGGGGGGGVLPGENDQKLDSTKTQLYVSSYDGGYGSEWLKAAAKRFEEKYANVSFETDKTGVQVWIDSTKDDGSGMISTIAQSRAHVFFNEQVDTYQYMTQGLALDITEAVKQPLSEFGDDESILDKFTAQQKEYLPYNDRIYFVPHYASIPGITIDVDLFDERKLFLGEDGKFNYTTADVDKLSKGPDGKKGTYDDGLPATYEEFYSLCSNISKRGIIPLTWTGEHQTYINFLLSALSANANGYDEAVLGLTFDGTSNKLVKAIDADGNVVLDDPTVITNANGYEIFRQQGYYYALDFVSNIISNQWYSSTSFTNAQSHTDAQDDYLLSSKDASCTPIAMIIEGCWWESEATSTFEQMSTVYKNAGKYDRRFRFIPLPKATNEMVGEGITLIENNRAYSFINANIEEKYKDLAIKFLQFCNTDESLIEFSTYTNTPKALDYQMKESDLAKCTYYGQSIFQILQDPNTRLINQLSNNEMFFQNISLLEAFERYSYGNVLHASTAFKDKVVANGKDYFNNLGSHWENTWSTKFGKYI